MTVNSEIRFNTGTPPAPAPAAPAGATTDANGTVNITNTPAPEPAKTPEGQTQEQRPEWLPEKFKSAEDLAKAYKELESKQNTPKAKPSANTEGGVSYEALTKEFIENGELSEDTLASLEKSGIPRPMVDAYVKGQQALANQARTELGSAVGGAEKLGEVMKWAGENLSADEISGYNALIDGGNYKAAKVLLEQFAGRYTEAMGTDPAVTALSAGNGSSRGLTGYASAAEMTKDMRDPRYEKDPAYRNMVKSRVAITTAF